MSSNGLRVASNSPIANGVKPIDYSAKFIYQISHLLNGRSDHPIRIQEAIPEESKSLHECGPDTAWMWRCRQSIANRSLNDIVIPGAHDAGTYSLTNDSSYADDLKHISAVRIFNYVGLGSAARSKVCTWARCQNATLQQQLEQGIRYFDLRFACLKGEFHIWHGLCGEAADSILDTLTSFARSHPTEIIIIDLIPSHFNDFSVDNHRRFIKMLMDRMGDIIAPASLLCPSSTIAQFWQHSMNIIVIYDPPSESLDGKNLSLFWTSVVLDSYWPKHCKTAQEWAGWADGHSDLRSPPFSSLHVLQGVITPDAGIILKFNGINDISDLSQTINPVVVGLLTATPNRHHNIIMLDFYDNSMLIPACHWVNVGGSAVFTERAGFRSNCQMQISYCPSSIFGPFAVSVAMDTHARWSVATLQLSKKGANWTDIGTLNIQQAPEPSYRHLGQSFILNEALWLALPRSSGTKLFRMDPNSKVWTLKYEITTFGSQSGFGAKPSFYRSTFKAVSHPNSNKAYLIGYTIHGLSVVQITDEQTPVTYCWLPSEEMHPGSNIKFEPFVLHGRLYLLCQGPTSFFSKLTHLSQVSSRYCLFLCSFDQGNFTPLQLAGAPPAIVPHLVSPSAATTSIISENANNDQNLMISSHWMIEVCNGEAYIACRTPLGLRIWNFDGTQIAELPSFNGFCDAFNWNLPCYSNSLRMFSIRDNLYILGRSSHGIVIVCKSPDSSNFVPVPGISEFTDSHGWNQDNFSSGLQITPITNGNVLLTGRHIFGILSVQFDGKDWNYFERPSKLNQHTIFESIM